MTLSTSLVAVWYSSDSSSSRGALPQFAEQPRIVHRNHRLGREVFQERDLLVRERPHLVCDCRRSCRAARRLCAAPIEDWSRTAALGGCARNRFFDQAQIGNVDKGGPGEQRLQQTEIWRTLNPRRSCSAKSCGKPLHRDTPEGLAVEQK